MLKMKKHGKCIRLSATLAVLGVGLLLGGCSFSNQSDGTASSVEQNREGEHTENGNADLTEHSTDAPAEDLYWLKDTNQNHLFCNDRYMYYEDEQKDPETNKKIQGISQRTLEGEMVSFTPLEDMGNWDSFLLCYVNNQEIFLRFYDKKGIWRIPIRQTEEGEIPEVDQMEKILPMALHSGKAPFSLVDMYGDEQVICYFDNGNGFQYREYDRGTGKYRKLSCGKDKKFYPPYSMVYCKTTDIMQEDYIILLGKHGLYRHKIGTSEIELIDDRFVHSYDAGPEVVAAQGKFYLLGLMTKKKAASKNAFGENDIIWMYDMEKGKVEKLISLQDLKKVWKENGIQGNVFCFSSLYVDQGRLYMEISGDTKFKKKTVSMNSYPIFSFTQEEGLRYEETISNYLYQSWRNTMEQNVKNGPTIVYCCGLKKAIGGKVFLWMMDEDELEGDFPDKAAYYDTVTGEIRKVDSQEPEYWYLYWG